MNLYMSLKKSKFNKLCPECGKIQYYCNKYTFTNSNRKKTKCLPCAARDGYWKNVDHVGENFGNRIDCYVYCYYDPNTNEPFYVGKGVDDRYLFHLKEIKETTENLRKFNKIQKLIRNGTPPIVKRLVENLSAKEAYSIESREIEFLGRKDYDLGGILLNICKDSRPPDRTGTHFTEEHRINHKKALKEYYETHISGNLGKKKPQIIEFAKKRYKMGIGIGGMEMNGKNNPRAIKWKFIDPNNKIFEVDGEFEKFCKDHNLSEPTFKKSLRTGKWSTYGKNLGWKVERVI